MLAFPSTEASRIGEDGAHGDEMSEILSWAERAWNGELAETFVSPTTTSVGLVELLPRTAFVAAFANTMALDTSDGLVMVDTSSMFHAHAVHTAPAAGHASRCTPPSIPTAMSITSSALCPFKPRHDRLLTACESSPIAPVAIASIAIA